jgi:diguanylate cyclase (GGDEF)-like protein
MIKSLFSRERLGVDPSPSSVANVHDAGFVHISTAVIANWDALLRLVMANLSVAIGDPDDWKSEQYRLDRSRTIRSDVVQCVSALGHMHAALTAHSTQANPDCLVLLPSSDCFRERLAREMRGIDPSLAVIYINLDEFSRFVDSHGRDVGEQVLKTVAARLLVAIRCRDVLSRIADNEFACLVQGLTHTEALTSFAHKLLAAVLAPVAVGSLSLSVRPSIGIARYPGGGVCADDLLANAKSAMRTAQRQRFAFSFAEEC